MKVGKEANMNVAVLFVRVLALAEFLSFTLDKLGFSTLADGFTVLVLLVALVDAFGILDRLIRFFKKHKALIFALTLWYTLLAVAIAAS